MFGTMPSPAYTDAEKELQSYLPTAVDFIGIPGTEFTLGHILREQGGMGQLNPALGGAVSDISNNFFKGKKGR